MTFTIAELGYIITLVIVVAGFVITRLKEAENRGRMLQRIDELESTLKELRDHHRKTDDKIGCHESDLVKITSDMDSLKALIERMDKKLDKVLDRDYPRPSNIYTE